MQFDREPASFAFFGPGQLSDKPSQTRLRLGQLLGAPCHSLIQLFIELAQPDFGGLALGNIGANTAEGIDLSLNVAQRELIYDARMLTVAVLRHFFELDRVAKVEDFLIVRLKSLCLFLANSLASVFPTLLALRRPNNSSNQLLTCTYRPAVSLINTGAGL